ncbi:beta-galactosidase [uncultured Muribaculum sp.]|uniref:beta-galactosidase n=1 Tax=uncultured Muribaculum sp. TaxID=1918613 RepID=UPI0025A9FAA1|nr:beta-galactosidase [uncultured Muribaculum sp.]
MKTAKYFFIIFALAFTNIYASSAKPTILPAYKNPTPGEFPILGWYSIPDSASTRQRYNEMREAGFNISFSHFTDNAQISRAAKACRGTGIKIIAGSPQLEASTKESIDSLKQYGEIAGWFLRDEPVVSGFGYLSQFRDSVYAADTTRLVYLNLFPRMVEPKNLGTATYDDYLREFLKQIRLPFISYDMYPVHETSNGEAVLQPMLFTNLESAQRVSREFGVPFWAFCLSTAHTPYPVARAAHLEVEAFSALAYGAQGIQYFTYWQPVSKTWNFYHAPIDKFGKRTDVYYLIRNLNKEIQALAPVFLGAEVISVSHTGKHIPDDTHRLTSLPMPFLTIDSDGPGVLVSHLHNNGKQYLMIVNRDIQNAQKVTLSIGSKKVRQIMPNGTTTKLSTTTPVIEPGRYVLYVWK